MASSAYVCDSCDAARMVSMSVLIGPTRTWASSLIGRGDPRRYEIPGQGRDPRGDEEGPPPAASDREVAAEFHVDSFPLPRSGGIDSAGRQYPVGGRRCRKDRGTAASLHESGLPGGALRRHLHGAECARCCRVASVRPQSCVGWPTPSEPCAGEPPSQCREVRRRTRDESRSCDASVERSRSPGTGGWPTFVEPAIFDTHGRS